MRCVELVELLGDIDSGALGTVTGARVRWHLLLCRGCRAYLAQLRATVATVARIAGDDVDPLLRCRLLEAFRDRP